MTVFNEILIMLESNIPFDQAVQFYVEASRHRHRRKIKDLFQKGMGDCMVIRYLMPWWCPYPFENNNQPLNIRLFLESYQRYLKSRRDVIQYILTLLTYPFILSMLSFGLAVMVQFYVMPMMASQVETSSLSWFLWLNMAMNIVLILILLKIIRSLFCCQLWDVCNIIVIALEQNWSWDTILTNIFVGHRLHVTVQALYGRIINSGEFSDSFGYIFNLNKSAIFCLKSFENSGNLTEGFKKISDERHDVFIHQVKKQVRIIQLFLYGMVLCSILLVLHGIYSPINDLQITK